MGTRPVDRRTDGGAGGSLSGAARAPLVGSRGVSRIRARGLPRTLLIMSPAPAEGIEVEGLVREFKNGPRAVDGIELAVSPGEIYGSWGRTVRGSPRRC